MSYSVDLWRVLPSPLEDCSSRVKLWSISKAGLRPRDLPQLEGLQFTIYVIILHHVYGELLIVVVIFFPLKISLGQHSTCSPGAYKILIRFCICSETAA